MAVHEVISKTSEMVKMTKVKDTNLEIQQLTEENEFLRKQLEIVSVHEKMLVEELESIKAMSMFEFADNYCSDDDLEEAGHQLARSLGVGQ